MADCTTAQNKPGKIVTVGWVEGCGDDDFLSLTYKPFGTINTKQLTYDAQTTNTTSDQSGAVTSEIIVRTSLDLTVSGFRTMIDSATTAQTELIRYYFDELQAAPPRQPTVWLKISGDGYDTVWHIFANYKGGTESFNTDDAITGEWSFSVTDTGTSLVKAVNLSDPI